MKTRFINLSLLILSIVLLIISCKPNPMPPIMFQGNWVSFSQIPGLARTGAGSWVIGDTGYIVGGYNSTNDSCLSDLWQYTPVSNSWVQKANFPGSVRQSGVGFAVGMKGYLATGYNPKSLQRFQDCWQYDPSSNNWIRMADLPDFNGAGTGARYDAVAFTVGNYGYLGTGYNGVWLNDFWQFDPLANKWTAINNSPVTKRSGAVAFVYFNEVYICAGSNNADNLKDFWKYNPGTDKWTRLRDIANTSPDSYDDDYTDIARDHAIGLVQPFGTIWKAYLAVGQNAGSSLIPYTWEYDFATDLWQRKTSFEKAPRTGAIGWSFLNLKKGMIGTGKTTGKSLDDFNWWYPDQTYNVND